MTTFKVGDKVVVSDYAKNYPKEWANTTLKDAIGTVIDFDPDSDSAKIVWKFAENRHYDGCWFDPEFLTLLIQKPRRRL